MKTAARRVFFLACVTALFIFFSIPSRDPEIEPLVVLEVRGGERMKDLVDRLEKMRLTTADDVAAFAAAYAPSDFPVLPHPRRDPARFEGMIRPGTYCIPLNTLRTSARAGESSDYSAARCIITHLLDRSRQRYAAASYNGLSPYQQAVLASIVEKEAVAGTDYGNVASVFINRLNCGMRLCSCPTLEYALGYHRPFLTIEDLKLDSPYNVYRYPGLPPTPICFFSDASLEAVRTPPDTRWLFFVFDWTGNELKFAEDWAGHRRNVREARARYERKFGKKGLYEKYPDRYYEDVTADSPAGLP